MLRKGNVLVIDDNPAILATLKEEFSHLADKVYVALDGVEGLTRLERDAIHCIVCDYEMPTMNGMEVLRHLRARNVDIPFIFYTGQHSYPLLVEAAKLRSFGLLLKPDQERLGELIEKALKVGLEEGQKRPLFAV